VQLKMKITCGGEVKWAGVPDNGPAYYGGPPPDSGLWKLSTQKLEDYFDSVLKFLSFGDSIDIFVLGFEIAELEGWGDYFTSMSSYISYRPKSRSLISVGQLNWLDVKDLPANEQFKCFSGILLGAIGRIADMKRKPRDFDHVAFQATVQRMLARCPVEQIEA